MVRCEVAPLLLLLSSVSVEIGESIASDRVLAIIGHCFGLKLMADYL